VVIFIDSSALLTVLDADEERHTEALQVWHELLESDAVLLTTNYVLLETAALAQRRLGLNALRYLHDQITPALTIDWISEEAHARGLEATLFAARRGLSVVDCVSFRSMRQHHAGAAFAFDAHFREQGFTVIPTSSPA
jgi:predicted nucleic acid-binding protein